VLERVLPKGDLEVDDAPQPLKHSFSDDLLDGKQAQWLGVLIVLRHLTHVLAILQAQLLEVLSLRVEEFAVDLEAISIQFDHGLACSLEISRK